jgi:hypothetical protein
MCCSDIQKKIIEYDYRDRKLTKARTMQPRLERQDVEESKKQLIPQLKVQQYSEERVPSSDLLYTCPLKSSQSGHDASRVFCDSNIV